MMLAGWLYEIKKDKLINQFVLLLAYQDSNLDKQNQNLSYYHYTIGQSVPNGSAKIIGSVLSAKKFSEKSLFVTHISIHSYQLCPFGV